MTDREIFRHLFSIAQRSDDTKGVVASCLVRDDEILSDGVSMSGGVHSEFNVLKSLGDKGISIFPDDVFYTTVEPCGKRTPGGAGEKMGDCTTNLIKAGVKHVVYAAADPDASSATRHKFAGVGCSLSQVSDKNIIKEAVELFNSTNVDSSGHLSL